MNSNALLFLFYSLLFWLLAYLIIRKSKSPTNLLFSSSMFLYGIGTIFSALGWGPFALTQSHFNVLGIYDILINQLTFFAIAASFIIVAPLGIYFSGRVILHGNSGYKDELAIILIIVFIIIAIFNLFIYPVLLLRQNFMFEDSLTTLILVISLIVYFELYRTIPDYRTNFLFILIGFGIGIIALLTGLSLFLMGNDTLAESIRSFGPFTSVFIVLISFTNLPQAIRNRNH